MNFISRNRQRLLLLHSPALIPDLQIFTERQTCACFGDIHSNRYFEYVLDSKTFRVTGIPG